jgi:hypothetical protein
MMSLPKEEAIQIHGAYVAYTDAMKKAGACVGNSGLRPTSDKWVRLSHPIYERQINTKAAIRNINMRKATSDGNHDVYSYGVQLTGLDPTHRIILQNLTYQVLVEDRQSLL